MYQKVQVNFLSLIIVLLLVNTLFTPKISAQGEQALIIKIYDSNDWNESVGTILYEGKNYDIIVSTENESFILGVNISLLGTTYFTSTETPFVTVTAPRFNESESFVITATKEGYFPAEIEITVMKGELSIEIYDSNDWNESVGTILYEGKNYDIIVSTENESFILGVNISLLGTTYFTSTETPFVTVTAPRFNESESFVITATKEGYFPAEIEITVMKGELLIVADHGTVEEKKELRVTVTDQDNKPVEGALVYVTPEGPPVTTDLQGVAYAYAPETEMVATAMIKVIKSGYLPGSTTIRVEHIEGFILGLPESKFLQLLPVLIASLVVIFAIAYVLWRQKRTPTIPTQTIRTETLDKPQTYRQEKLEQRFKNKPALFSVKEKSSDSFSNSASRVEEIRIPVQVKKKETTYLTEEKKLDEVSEDQKKETDEWFKGQDYMRYRIDELTGKIDQKTDGKWFEGEREIKYKVDETLKKNFKKKKVDEEEIK